jgi:hypothetical protein
MRELKYYLPKSVSESDKVGIHKTVDSYRPTLEEEELRDVEPEVLKDIRETVNDIVKWVNDRLGINLEDRLRIPKQKIHIFDQDGFDKYKKRNNLDGDWGAFAVPTTQEIYIVLDGNGDVVVSALVHELVHIGSFTLFVPSETNPVAVNSSKFLYGFNNKDHFDFYNEVLTETITNLIRGANEGRVTGEIGYYTGVIGLDVLMRYATSFFPEEDVKSVLNEQYVGYFTGSKKIFTFLKKVIGIEGIRFLSSIGVEEKTQIKKRKIEYLVEFFSRFTNERIVQQYLETVYDFEHGETFSLLDGVEVIPENFAKKFNVKKNEDGSYSLI